MIKSILEKKITDLVSNEWLLYIENICPDLWKTRKARRSSSWSKESADQAANCPEMHFPISGDLLAAVLVSRACVRTRRYERTSLCRYFGEWTQGRREYVFDRWITQYSVTLTRGRDEGPRVPCREEARGISGSRRKGLDAPRVTYIYTVAAHRLRVQPMQVRVY